MKKIFKFTQRFGFSGNQRDIFKKDIFLGAKTQQIKELKRNYSSLYSDLTKRSTDQQTKITEIEIAILNLKNQIEKIENEVDTLKKIFMQIDIREIFTSLEQHIVLDVMKSKNQMKLQKIYTIEKMKPTIEFKNNKKWNNNESEEIFDLILYYKEVGNKIFHNNNKDVIIEYLTSDDNDEELIKKTMNFLENYCKESKKTFGKSPFFKE
jgi:hypothetical protein